MNDLLQVDCLKDKYSTTQNKTWEILFDCSRIYSNTFTRIFLKNSWRSLETFLWREIGRLGIHHWTLPMGFYYTLYLWLKNRKKTNFIFKKLSVMINFYLIFIFRLPKQLFRTFFVQLVVQTLLTLRSRHHIQKFRFNSWMLFLH